MTKRIVSFGAIVAMLGMPLTVHAQPTRGTAGAGVATGTATRTVAGAPERAGGAVLSADQSAKVHEYVMKEKRPSVKVTQKVAVGTVLPTSVELRERDELGVRELRFAESRHICLHSVDNRGMFAPSPPQPRSGHLVSGVLVRQMDRRPRRLSFVSMTLLSCRTKSSPNLQKTGYWRGALPGSQCSPTRQKAVRLTDSDWLFSKL